MVKNRLALKKWGVVVTFLSLLQGQGTVWAAVKEEAVRFRIRGYQLQHRGRLEEAIENYQKAIVADPAYAAPHNDLGIIYESRGWKDKAEQEFQEALRLDPKYLDAYFNLATLYEERGDKEKAIAYLKKRVELGKLEDIGTQEAQARLDHLTEEQPSPSAEISVPTQQIKTAPEQIAAPPEKQLVSPGTGRRGEIIRSKPIPTEPIERETTPVDPAVELRNRGLTWQKSGNLEEAIASYKKALELRPDFATVHNDLGILYEDQGKLEEAEASYQRALSINPRYRLAEYNLSLLYEKQGHLPEVIQHLEHFIVNSAYDDPWTRQAHERLSAIHSQIARQEEARRQKEEEARQAALEEERRRDEEAALREKVRQEVEQEENRQRAQKISEFFDKGKKAFREKRFDEALESFEALLVLDPQNKVGQDYYEKIKKQKGDLERQALEVSRRQIQEEKQARQRDKEKKLSELFDKGKKAYREKQYDEALHHFEAMLLVDPNTSLANDYLQKCREKVQEQERNRLAELQEKLTEEKRQKELEETRRREAEEQYEEAQARFREGDLREAKRLFEAFLAVQPDHAYARRYIERIQEKMKEQEGKIASSLAEGERALQEGRHEAAAEAFREVLALDPSHSQAKEKLQVTERLLEKARQEAHARKEKVKLARLQQAEAKWKQRKKELARRSYQEGLQDAKEGKTSDALAAFEKTFMLDPTHKAAQRQLTRMQERLAFEETKDWRAKKEEGYRKGFVKEESKLLYDRALAAYEAGDLLLARETLEYLLVLVPDHPYARADLERVEERLRTTHQKVALEKASLKRETKKALKTPLVPIEHAQQAPLSRAALPRMQEVPLETKGESFLEGEGVAHGLMKRVALGYSSKGSTLLAMDDIDGAIAYYRKAQAIEPSSQVANSLGILYERKRMQALAEEAYREALTLDPKYLAAHTNLALLYEKQGRYGEAAAHWKIRADLGVPEDLWTQRARTHLKESPDLRQPARLP